MAAPGIFPLAALATGLVGFIAGCGSKSDAVPAERVADYIYAVIQANRTTYASDVVDRLQDVEQGVKVSEHFREDKALPLPPQIVRMSSERITQTDGFRYGLKSLWPLNNANGPNTAAEQVALEAVIKNPDAPYRSYQTINGKKFLLTVYADKATSMACIQCHNNHKASPRRDQVLGGVMGGTAIYVPVD